MHRAMYRFFLIVFFPLVISGQINGQKDPTVSYVNGILTVNGVRYEMISIPAGEFLMGSEYEKSSAFVVKKEVKFYTKYKESENSGEYLGSAVLDHGKLTVNITDERLSRLVRSKVIVRGGEVQEKTYPDGQKTVVGGIMTYAPGTPEHLEAIINSVPKLGYCVLPPPYYKYENETPQHRVKINAFKLGKTEVTLGLWSTLISINRSSSKHRVDSDQYPVDSVFWEECQGFIFLLNKKTGKHFRLPTEAEWEYACRAGTTGDRYGELDDIAWYQNSEGSVHPVGQKSPNTFGLYDMLGNVWEWCQDWFDLYSSSFADNPQGPILGKGRVIRGGGYVSQAGGVRSASRSQNNPGSASSYLGFRLALDESNEIEKTIQTPTKADLKDEPPANERSDSLFPSYSQELSGSNEVRVKNPNEFSVKVGLRSENQGKNFAVNANATSSVFIPDGSYEIYFIYSNEPKALYKGDSFTLSNNGVEIQIVQRVDGNFGIKRVK